MPELFIFTLSIDAIMDIVKYNSAAWDRYVEKKDRWTIPVTDEDLERAKGGEWKVVLTPTKAVPPEMVSRFKRPADPWTCIRRRTAGPYPGLWGSRGYYLRQF